MRIVHVEDCFDPNAGYQINELISNNNDTNTEMILITSDDMSRFHKNVDTKSDIEFEKKYNVKIIRLKKLFGISSRILMKDLYKTIDNLNPDVVFFHGIGDFKDLLLLKRKKNYIIFRDCHMSWAGSKNKLKLLYFYLFKKIFAKIINETDKYNKIFSLGIEEYEYLLKLGISKDKIIDLPHGYSKKTMYYSEEERKNKRQLMNVSNSEILISYIGKFNYYKRPDLLFDMLEKINLDDLNIKIKILFMGPKDEEYMELFNEKLSKFKLKSLVLVQDGVSYENLYKFYSASDICVFPKETSLSSIHAQICDCHVIMENHTSNKERVINNNNLYDINDIDSGSEVLENILRNFHDIPKTNIKKLESREYTNQCKLLNSIANSEIN